MSKEKGTLTGDDWEATVTKVAEEIYDAKLKGPISEDMVKAIAQELMDGINLGLDAAPLGAVDDDLLAAIEKNVYVFSGFKNYQQLREAANLLKDEDGNIRSFADFKADVLAMDATYNQVYLATEYETATTTAIEIGRYQKFVREKDIAPNLVWSAVNDETTCEVCGDLNGTVFAIGSDFDLTYGCPAHWRCKCRKVQATDDEQLTPDEDQPAPDYPKGWEMFKHNAGVDGVIFPKGHPYYEASKEASKQVLKSVLPLVPSFVSSGKSTPFTDNLGNVAGKVKQPVLSAVAAIDAVITLPDLPTLDIVSNQSKTAFGWYVPGKDKIAIREEGRHMEMTAAHEFGHFIDHTAFTGVRKWETALPDNGKLKEAMGAIRDTEQYKRLSAAAKSRIYIDEDGKETKLTARQVKYATYLATDIELWARAFSQYIAYKSGNEAMLKQCEGMAENILHGQWEPNDFKNVIFALDKTFDDLGWLKK